MMLTPVAMSTAYAVTKAAEIHLLKSLAIIAAPAIRVTASLQAYC
jgi:NAD(P)-dependent dehydrogenase (short-subunit alcohol dehydrogenase family)